MVPLLFKTLWDLKQPAILVRLFIPFLAGMILVSLLGYGLFGVLLTSDMVTGSATVTHFESWRMEAEQEIAAIPFVGAMLLWLLSMAMMVVAGILGVLLGSYLVLIFAMIIVGFMTDSLVKAVRDTHYPEITYSGHGTTTELLWKMTKYSLVMLLVVLLTLPLFLIPLINLIWFWVLGFLFFRYMMVLDVGSVILPEETFAQVRSVTEWQPTSVLMVLFLVSTLPFMAFLAPVLAVIALSHYYFGVLSEQQGVFQMKSPEQPPPKRLSSS